MHTEDVFTDVLVIGGGLAGIVAAIRAREAGRDVALLSRSMVGKGGNTIVSGAMLSVYRKDNPFRDTRESFICDTLSSGNGLSSADMVARFVDESEAAFDMLERYGVAFRYVEGERLIKQPPGHSHRRSYPTDFRAYNYMSSGLALGIPLRQRAMELGVRFFERCDALSLICCDGRVYGAHAADADREGLLCFHAAAVILSCGGGARIFGNTNNTSDVTCDSYRLALEAGAYLRDMEFVQFHPTMMFRPAKVVISNPLFGDGAVVRNRYGDEFLERYSPMGNMTTRDLMARAIQTEIRDGRGNPEYVYVDCSGVDGHIIDTKYAELKARLAKCGLDLKKDLIPVAPTAHFYLGGVCVNERCASAVAGLYACGEAIGGLHGANRLSGNALTEAAVTGRIAGSAAAEELCRGTPDKADYAFSLPQPAGASAGDVGSIHTLTETLRKAMWDDASVIKNERGLAAASDISAEVKEKCGGIAVQSYAELRKYYQLRSFLAVSEMLLTCAQKRKESRGAFYREDYPDTEEEWKGSQICSRHGRELSVRFEANTEEDTEYSS